MNLRWPVIVLFSGFSLAGPTILLAEETIMDYIQQNKQYFLVMCADNASEVESGFDLTEFLSGLPKTGSERDVCNRALNMLISLGMRQSIRTQYTGYIQDQRVVDMLVLGLSDDDSRLRRLCIDALTWSTYQEDLEKRAGRIAERLVGSRNDYESRLLAKLPLSPDVRESLLKVTVKDTEIQARLGVSDAENMLIEAFSRALASTTKGGHEAGLEAEDVSALARKLGYIGTSKCAEALVVGLKCEGKMADAIEEKSVRFCIVSALGLIYQHEPLFTRDAIWLNSSSDLFFDKFRGLKAYCEDINFWAEKNFGTRPLGGDKPFFRRSFDRAMPWGVPPE